MFILIVFLLVTNIAHSFDYEFKQQYQVGSDYTYNLRKKRLHNSLIWSQANWQLSKNKHRLKLELLYWHNLSQQKLLRKNELRFIEGYYQYSHDNWQLRAGMLQKSWGETFGVHTPDVVNAKDYQNLFFSKDEWSKLANFGLEFSHNLNKWSWELLFFPKARQNIFPLQFRSLKLENKQNHKFFKDFEAGAKISYLADYGAEISLHYFYHYSRLPLMQFNNNPANPLWQIHNERMHTIALSYNQAWQEWVLRSDLVFNKDIFNFNNPIPEKSNLLSWVIGVDRSFNDGRGDFALQLHNTQAFDTAADNSNNHWLSGRIQYSFLDQRLLAEFTPIWGFGDKDIWIKWWLISRISYAFDLGLELNLTWNLLDGRQWPSLNLEDNYHQLNFAVKYIF